MKIHPISDSDIRKRFDDPGSVTEEAAAFEYGYDRFVDSDYYDARRDSGSVIEVKSTLPRIATAEDDSYPAAGRFRLWKGQHEKLVRHDRRESAFYVFGVVDRGAAEIRMVRRDPADVGRTIGARGGWYTSGHDSQGRQYKLPIDAIF
jgi:hypothetical protein